MSSHFSPDAFDKPSIADLARIYFVLDHLSKSPDATEDSISQAKGIDKTTISNLMTSFRYLMGGKELTNRRGKSYGVPSDAGIRLMKLFRPVLNNYLDLTRQQRSFFFKIATTNSILLYILPGAVAAFNLFGARRLPDKYVEVIIDDKNYPEMIKGVLDGTYNLGIGWETDPSFLANLDDTQRPLRSLLDGVTYTVMIPDKT